MISSGRISVFIGMLPAMKITEPYSPTPRAKARAKPVSQAGSGAGTRIWRNTCSGLAPRQAAASSTSLGMSASTGCTVRTTNGRVTKVSARVIPRGV